ARRPEIRASGVVRNLCRTSRAQPNPQTANLSYRHKGVINFSYLSAYARTPCGPGRSQGVVFRTKTAGRREPESARVRPQPPRPLPQESLPPEPDSAPGSRARFPRDKLPDPPVLAA